MRLNAIGGLSNRLQAVLSRRGRGHLDVVWLLDDPPVPVRFEDLFEPLPDVTFHDNGSADVQAWDVVGDAPEGWELGYRDLKPRKEILDRIAELNVGTYAAAHIRRSVNHANLARAHGQFTTDDEFDEWIGALSKPMPAYLATDNAETQRRFLAKWGTRGLIVGREIRSGEADQRDRAIHTSLADAVVDLYVCAGAALFKGSGFSSFTDTIERLRALR